MISPFSTFLASCLLLTSVTSVGAAPAWVGTPCTSTAECRDFSCDLANIPDDCKEPDPVLNPGVYNCPNYCSDYVLFLACRGTCVNGKCEEGFLCSSHGNFACVDVCTPGDWCKPNEGGTASLCSTDMQCEAKMVCPSLLSQTKCNNYPGGICEWSGGECNEKVQCESRSRDDCKATTGCGWIDTECAQGCYKAPAHHQCEVVENRGECNKMGCYWRSNSQCGGYNRRSSCEDNGCHWMSKKECAALTVPFGDSCKSAGCRWRNDSCKKKCTGMCSGQWDYRSLP